MPKHAPSLAVLFIEEISIVQSPQKTKFLAYGALPGSGRSTEWRSEISNAM